MATDQLDTTSTETPAQKAARLSAAALKEKQSAAQAAKGLVGTIKSAGEAAVSAQEGLTAGGTADIRRASAERLSGALAGSPQTGAGARLAAARGMGQQGLAAEQGFMADQASRVAALRTGAAEKVGAAEKSASEASMEALAFEKDLASPEEDKTARMTQALQEVNDAIKTGEYVGTFFDDTDEASKAVSNIALKYKDLDPELYSRLMKLSIGIGSGAVPIDEGVLTITSLGIVE